MKPSIWEYIKLEFEFMQFRTKINILVAVIFLLIVAIMYLQK